MAAATAIARSQIIQPSSFLKPPPLIFSKPLQFSPISFTINNNFCKTRLLQLSVVIPSRYSSGYSVLESNSSGEPLQFPPISFSVTNIFCKTRLRQFSVATPRCSSSGDSVLESNPSGVGSWSIVGDLLDYLNESWTHFHATAEAKRQLMAAGFHLLSENDEWNLKPGGRYFFTRNMSSLVAFAIGEKILAGNGFHIIAAQTDSPCLKLKPKSASCKSGYLMVNVQTYGGGLWHTWFGRDLSVAGRVILRSDDGCFLHKLVKIRRPLLRVPTLAIHLDCTVNQDGFKPNLETHLIPLLATKTESSSGENKDKNNTSCSQGSHHPLLMQILSDELGCKVDDIANIELNLCDTQPSCLGGANNEFIFSGRLDILPKPFVRSELLLILVHHLKIC